MALLLDNDVVDKLAQLDLLQEAKTLLISEFGQLKILDTLKYKLCPKKESKRKKRNTIVMSRIEDFIKDDIIEISCPVEDSELQNALAIPGLDIGEMQLLQALFKPENELLFTSDKKFLKALSNVEALGKKLEQVSGSFICLEQIIYFLINQLGFEHIKLKFIQALDDKIEVDTTLRCCFGGARTAIKERVIENIFIQIEDLRKDSNQLLANSEKWLPPYSDIDLA